MPFTAVSRGVLRDSCYCFHTYLASHRIMCRGVALECSVGGLHQMCHQNPPSSGSLTARLLQLLFISDGICLRPGGAGSFPPLSSRQFADLPVFLPRTLCQSALSHFPSKEEDLSASGLLAEAARPQFVAHGEGFLFLVVLYIHSC